MKRHRLRRKLPLLATLAAITIAVGGYVFGLALLQSHLYAYYDFEDLIQPRLIDATIVSWLLFFCSSIGSFLNVVAWRMPRGEGIGGHSHCPRCANTLKIQDNVPILGWISLAGRCRFCSLPISRRYPIVEALVGITLTLIGITQLYSLSLPAQFVHGHDGPLWAPRVSPELLAILTYHTVAVSTLWAMALIRIDGTRLPARLVVFAGVVLVIPMLAYPTVMVVPWQASRPMVWVPDGLHVDAIMRVASALVAAALFGRVLAKGLCPSADLKLDPLGGGTARLVDLIAMLSVPALVIGWQSMPALVIVAAVLAIVLRPLLRWIPINDGPRGQIARRGAMESFAFALPFALTLHLVFWRVLWETPAWPSDHSSRNVIIIAALTVLAVPFFLTDRTTATASDDGQLKDPGDEDEGVVDDVSTDELPEHHCDAESDDGDQRRDDPPSP
ncbi:Leader peptidase PppA [Stieleria maiorica]|uniref:Leader peptidase PppA n=1 Tax=Stieleria maiorica TaxID=2795974 RepID=A0A5B9MMC5_9BACT|nr:A24 family peptidase [Stieleria maiorica]QEG01181.1 Leader peptidase PppA [Stieleria maiorica]